MKKFFTILILVTAFMSGFAQTRVIVMSDIGGSDPDDTQSLVHLLVTLDQIELEGFISQHAWVPYGQGAIGLINGIIDRYESVHSNLMVHGKDFPTADYLRSIVKEGQKEAAMKGTGEGKDSKGRHGRFILRSLLLHVLSQSQPSLRQASEKKQPPHPLFVHRPSPRHLFCY